MNTKQRTIANTALCSGVGLHSGKQVNLKIKPAPVNHGIKFMRTDRPGDAPIPALFNMVVDTSLATVIGDRGRIVSTTEHLMSAFCGLCIDNVLVEIDDYEIPVMDGSAAVFTKILKEAGIEKQEAPRHYFIVKKPIELKKSDKFVGVYPNEEFKITCSIDFRHPLIGEQSISISVQQESFEKEICCSRTFGFFKDLQYMKHYGLAKGGTLENAVVIDENKILNQDGLRYSDEFVRHKLLDSMGDFSLIGMPVLGHFKLYKSGHQLNHEFLEKFFAAKDSWVTGVLS